MKPSHRGRLRRKLTTYQNSLLLRHIDHLFQTTITNREENLDDVIHFTEDAPAITIRKLQEFANCRKGKRIRKHLSTYIDGPWDEQFADLVAHELDINSVCFHLVDKDDISIDVEEISDLRQIADPESRRKATLAVLKKLRDLCSLGTFEVISADDVQKVA